VIIGDFIRTFPAFVKGSIREVTRGSLGYYIWVAFLVVLIFGGGISALSQFTEGLRVTAMRDQVSWGFYIGNFTFMVGVAAAAIMLVIPAYIYQWKPIKEIVVLGELLAIAAVVMCMLFVMVDLGRPDRMLHLVFLLQIPRSLLAWDVVVLNLYLLLNFVITTYLLFMTFAGRPHNMRLVRPLILVSIPAAVSIHTVTAFIYNGLPARPFWNASILAPRFLTSAFCSGPAILIIVLQIVRRYTKLRIRDEALQKVAELMAYSMFINLFLLGAEVFKEFYSGTQHLEFMEYLFFGLKVHSAVAPFMWISVASSVLAFFLFLIPRTRNHAVTMNIGCVLIIIGVYIEKGMGLVIPGFTPDTLGEIYEYLPTLAEWRVSIGILAAGALVYTLMVKVAVPIALGEFTYDRWRAGERG
jgi:molybdopterin-containing oxidoreductase family membrane subunit